MAHGKIKLSPAQRAKDAAEIKDNLLFRKAELAGHAVQGKVRQPGDKSPPDKPRTTLKSKGGGGASARMRKRLEDVKI